MLLCAIVYDYLWIAIHDPVDRVVCDPQLAEGIDKNRLDFCSFCDAKRLIGSHHCWKCGRCTEEFDHHCEYLNNCIGNKNYENFCACSPLIAYSTLTWLAKQSGCSSERTPTWKSDKQCRTHTGYWWASCPSVLFCLSLSSSSCSSTATSAAACTRPHWGTCSGIRKTRTIATKLSGGRPSSKLRGSLISDRFIFQPTSDFILSHSHMKAHFSN